MLQGHEPGARWKLQEHRVTTIGRSSRNEISLVHQSISRFHCEVSYINGLWYIADLNSKKGTILNGQPVKERDVLRPGDIVRLDKNVFKFDLIDETAKDDESMMAIRDAAMDAKAAGRGEGASLDDMRMRSQLGDEEDEEAAPRIPFKLLADVGVIVGAAIVVAVAVTVVHTTMQRKTNKGNELKAQWVKGAKEDYAGVTQQLVKAGPAGLAEGLKELKAVVLKYPGTEESAEALKKFREVEARWFEYEMTQISTAEQEGNFRNALAFAGALEENLTDPTLTDVVKEREEFTERLATVTFDTIRKDAQVLLDQGKVDEARGLFLKTAETIGVPKLETQAKFYADQIKNKGTGTELSQPPKMEPAPTPPKAAPKATPAVEPKPVVKPPAPPPPPEEDVEGKLKPLNKDEDLKPGAPAVTPGTTPKEPPKDPKKTDKDKKDKKKKDEGKQPDDKPPEDFEENFKPPVDMR